jgi:hypothetical protein
MGEVERHSSLQVRQLLAEGVGYRVERRIYIRMLERDARATRSDTLRLDELLSGCGSDIVRHTS